MFQRAEERINACEKRALNAYVLLVFVVKRILQCCKSSVLRADAKADLQHAARAVRHMWTDDGQRQGREAVAMTDYIKGTRHVGRGIGKGAVQIKQYRLDSFRGHDSHSR